MSRKVQGVPKTAPKTDRWVSVKSGGKQARVAAYTAPELAMVMNRKPLTINIWERRGIIPPPANYARKGGSWRIYTQDEVQVILDAYHESLAGEAFHLRRTKFPELVAAGFKALVKGVKKERYVKAA